MANLRLPSGVFAIAALLLAGAPAAVRAQQGAALDSTLLNAFRWRSVGPANMSGRVTDVEGLPSPSRTFYVAAAAGGIFKTTNGGTSFRPIFQNERIASMGDLAIAPSDSNVIWAGTGEEDSRNSISPGGGIYKSTDGGNTWKLMGLVETQQIGRIIVHPQDPNVVYVAALGHAWGPNPERGLYKTTDGGQTWRVVKFISPKTGFVDMAMDPTNPDVLFASSWERVRGPYFLNSGGPGSALWKTTDGGTTWGEIKGGGFPETSKGRIGIAIAPSNARVVYALVEADTVPNPKPVKGAAQQIRPSGLYRSNDGGTTWTKTASTNVRPFYYSQVRVDIKNPDRVYWSSTPVNFSDDGGKTVRSATQGIHVDHHAMWLDPNDENHFITGNDGGVAQTWDKGGNYDFLNTFAIGQFYAVSYDMAVPYRVCGGLQDNGSWCAPSRRKSGAITNGMWFTFNGGDGFYTAQDPNDPDVIYGESQGGNIARYQVSTGERFPFQKPNWRQKATAWEDSVLIVRGDTTQPETPATKKHLADLKAARAADSLNIDARWNWNTPFFLSPHSPTTVYMGASKVMKSTNRGATMLPISPDLSTKDTMKIRVSTSTTGGITPDVTGAETYGTITALAESPVRAGLLYAGTDDGNVWLSRNDGGAWENLTGRFPGLPANAWTSRIEPSPADTSTFYVAFDNHWVNDFAPYVYMTMDYGKTFKSIASNLPTGGPDFVHVIRESSANKNLLFLGTDVGAYVSFNRGGSWQKFMNGLPTTPVHDLKIHPRDRELIAATHGRSLWIVPIAALEQINDSILAGGNYLFQPTTAYQWGEPPVQGEETGHKVFRGQSAPYGADIAYRLTGGQRADRTKIVITDVKGDTIRTVQGPGGPGLHRATWDFRGKQPAPQPLGPSARRDSVLLAQRTEFVFDSLGKAGTFPKPMLGRVKTAISAGDTQALFAMFGGGGGGGSGGGSERFNPRPGETNPPGAGAQGEGAGAGGEAGGPVDPGLMSQLQDLLRIPGQRARGGPLGFLGGGGGRGGAPIVPPGDYLVSITVDGKTMKRALRVERTSGTGASTGGFPEDDDWE